MKNASHYFLYSSIKNALNDRSTFLIFRWKILFQKVNISFSERMASQNALGVWDFVQTENKPTATHLPVLGEISFNWITLQSSSYHILSLI